MGSAVECINLLKTQFASYLKTLKDLSFDSCKNEYLVTSEIQAYNFDKIKEIVPTFLHLCSCDVLYLTQKINFIEFKNSNSSSLRNHYQNIYNSAIDSYVILRYIIHILNPYIDLRSFQPTFTIVSKYSDNPRRALGTVMKRKLNIDDWLKNQLLDHSTTFTNLVSYFTNINHWLDIEFDSKILTL